MKTCHIYIVFYLITNITSHEVRIIKVSWTDVEITEIKCLGEYISTRENNKSMTRVNDESADDRDGPMIALISHSSPSTKRSSLSAI
jgi:C-terminal processing protease CtpA/Prc